MPNRPSATLYGLNVAIYAVIAFCGLWLGFNIRKLGEAEFIAVSMIVSVLAVNAAFCVLASGLTDRYQTRIAWIVPLFVTSIFLTRRGSRFSPT